MDRVALIVNPFASGVDEARLAAVEAALRTVAEVLTLRTERPRHGIELAERACKECQAVIVFSGDGGFNEALNGADGKVPVGFVPGGGTSVLPRALGLPRDPVRAAERLADAVARGRTRRISLGRVNGRRFGFSAGIGFDAELVRRMEGLGRADDGRRPGDLAFLRCAAGYIAERRGSFPPVLEVKGRGRAALAVVVNTDPYSFAGPLPLHIGPGARFELGLDLAAPARVRPWTVLSLAGYLLTGLRPLLGPAVGGHDLDRVEIACDRPLPLQADGEDLGDVDEAVFECERDALSVLF